ncbi:hypothetical protein MTR67_048388 [Solanum verrucosum]|uniref:Uncharacterized protein n=1 Tax=Solanum verrucosum TaxID=315347 RepID=A0AAF0V1D4_SOLVR|nr:hypothetical protein MTR67_048388 [Solanum verrucosum]
MIEVLVVDNSGGIVVLWDDNLVELDEIAISEQEIHVMIKGFRSGNLRAFWSFHKSFLLSLYCCIRLIFGSFCPILKEKELGFKRRRREEGEEEEKKEKKKRRKRRSTRLVKIIVDFVGGDPYQVVVDVVSCVVEVIVGCGTGLGCVFEL